MVFKAIYRQKYGGEFGFHGIFFDGPDQVLNIRQSCLTQQNAGFVGR